MENLSIYERLRIVPEEAKKSIVAGRLKGFTDINPMWRIKMLTSQFGPCGIGWKYVIKEQRLEEGCAGQISAFVTIDLFIKVANEWSEAIPGLGGSSFVANEVKGPYQSDECFKMALTDALGIACKSLGMAANVYFEKDRTKYDQEPVADNPIILALENVAICNNIEELQNIWIKNKGLQTNSTFIGAVNNRKLTLIQQ